MCEYHIDTHTNLFSFFSDATEQFGGNLFVRMNGRRTVLLEGQRWEYISSVHFLKKSWKGPNGSNSLIPKSEGDIYMMSGYQSKEFGLGLGTKLSLNNLAKINHARRNTKYVSSEDTILVNGSDVKPDIQDDPNLRFFHAGIRNNDIGIPLMQKYN